MTTTFKQSFEDYLQANLQTNSLRRLPQLKTQIYNSVRLLTSSVCNVCNVYNEMSAVKCRETSIHKTPNWMPPIYLKAKIRIPNRSIRTSLSEHRNSKLKQYTRLIRLPPFHPPNSWRFSEGKLILFRFMSCSLRGLSSWDVWRCLAM